jgi:hypothetical protein
MRYTSILFSLFFITSSSVFADYIHLKDGTLLKGKVLKVTDSSIEYDPEGDIPFDTVNRSNAEKIVYDNGKTVMLNDSTTNAPAGQNASSPVQTAADPVTGGPGFHTHDGFYFRGIIGYGIMNSTVSTKNGDLKFGGIDGNLDLQIGFAPINDTIIFVDYRYSGNAEVTKIKYQGKSYTSSDYKQSVYNYGYGLGLCQYIPGTQFSISGAIYSQFTLFDGDLVDEKTKNGFGFGFSAGYEWWASDNWGIGVIAFYYQGKSDFDKSDYSDQKSYDYQISKTTYRTIGVGMSFTYN